MRSQRWRLVAVLVLAVVVVVAVLVASGVFRVRRDDAAGVRPVAATTTIDEATNSRAAAVIDSLGQTLDADPTYGGLAMHRVRGQRAPDGIDVRVKGAPSGPVADAVERLRATGYPVRVIPVQRSLGELAALQ